MEEEESHCDASEREENAQDEDSLEINEWERKRYYLCKKIEDSERLKGFIEDYISDENFFGKYYSPLTRVKHSNPILVKYLERRVQEAQAAVNEIMDIGVRCLETSIERMVLFKDYINYTNYKPQFSSLSDVECLKEPDVIIKIENMGQKQGPFSLRKREYELVGYKEKATVNLEYTKDKKIRITTEFLKHHPAPRFTYVLKDETGESKPLIRSCPARFKLDECGWDNVTYSRSFPAKETYKSEEVVEIEIHVESPKEKDRSFSETGTLLWTIHDYGRRKQEEKDGLIKCQLSPCFQTLMCEYRAHVKMYLNGYRRIKNKDRKCKNVHQDYLSDENKNLGNDENLEKEKVENLEKDEVENLEKDEVENLEKGENEYLEKDENEKKDYENLEVETDEYLTARLVLLTGKSECIPDFAPHRVTVTIFNPDDVSQRFTQSKIVDNVISWRPFYLRIGDQKEIEKLLINDTLYFKISIQEEKLNT